MTTTKPTILIIGNGSMGQRRLRLITEITSDYDIQTVDPNGQGTYTELPDDFEAAAMFVCSPPATHSAYLCEALSRNIPVFVEKPFCLPGELAQVQRAVEQATVPVMVGHNLLWHEGFQEFKAAAQALPDLRYYSARFGYQLDKWNRENKDSYSRYRVQGGGVLLDCLQDIDLAIEVTGGIAPRHHFQQVQSSDVTVDSEFQAITLGMFNGGSCLFNFDYLRPERIRRHIAGGNGVEVTWVEDDKDKVEASYLVETEAFLTWVADGVQPAILPDPFRALDFVRRVYSL